VARELSPPVHIPGYATGTVRRRVSSDSNYCPLCASYLMKCVCVCVCVCVRVCVCRRPKITKLQTSRKKLLLEVLEEDELVSSQCSALHVQYMQADLTFIHNY